MHPNFHRLLIALLLGATLLFIGCKDSHGSDDDIDIPGEEWPDYDHDYDYDPVEPCCVPEDDMPVPDSDIDGNDDLLCTPGATEPCPYAAPNETENIGPCKAGTRTCLPDGSGWMTCFGEVKPVYDLCDDGIDQDCNGTVDDLDVDGDGYIECGETLDCCWKFEDCPEPWNVYPGAPEIPGNGIDDNCNGEIDEITDDDELLPPDE